MADEQTVEPTVPASILNMSDEAMASFDPSTLIATEVAADEADDKQLEVKDEDKAEDDADEAEGDKPEDESAADEGDKAEKPDDDDIDPEDPDKDESEKAPEAAKKPQADSADTDESESKDEAKKDDTQSVDFEAEYKKLLTPFKANGREIQVKNVEDAIALMQMGANYNKKMAALKPNLKLMKLLENNGLLSEEKLSYLIDLEKKNPDAINKLVKDSGIDPMDLNAEKASGYKPGTYTVDDREIELDTVLEEIQDSSAYNQTLEIVSNKWDGASKQVIAKTPQLLKVINDHIESGIYDIISKEVERERTFGRLNGLSDIEAYRQVGDAIQARGGFNHLGRQDNKSPEQPVVVPPKPKKVDDDKLRDKKRAASSTKPAAPNVTAKDFNPLSLSDEEFSKQIQSKFL